MLHIEFITDLGAKVTVDATSVEEVLELQRKFGRLGWYSGDVPMGGFQFPLDNESDFDWSLLGGRKFSNDDGEDCVWCRGHVYKRRDLEEVNTKKMKMPRAIKYSRGARPTDPEHIREKADGDIEYVSLAIFRGGKRQERYSETHKRFSETREEPQTADTAGRIRQALDALGLKSNAHKKGFVEQLLSRPIQTLSELESKEAHALLSKLEHRDIQNHVRQFLSSE